MKTQTIKKKPKTVQSKKKLDKGSIKGRVKKNDLIKNERDTSLIIGGKEHEDKDHPHEYKTPKAVPEEIDKEQITNKPDQITNQKDQITNLQNEGLC